MDIIDKNALVKGYKNCNDMTGYKNICDTTKKMVVGSIKIVMITIIIKY